MVAPTGRISAAGTESAAPTSRIMSGAVMDFTRTLTVTLKVPEGPSAEVILTFAGPAETAWMEAPLMEATAGSSLSRV